MRFIFGKASEAELRGVDPRLVNLVRRALSLSPVDFAVHDGLRTLAEQREYVRRGASHTMKSNHLTGRAVDLVPVINGKKRWEWEPIYTLAAAMGTAANIEGVRLRWGGVWDRALNDLDEPPFAPRTLARAVEAYAARRRKAKRRVFLDGPHFELMGK
jgi:peptidoglycan LD-endopeptidase CwlK